MAYYIIFFDHHGKVNDVVRFYEEEYSDYLQYLNTIPDTTIFQHGYF